MGGITRKGNPLVREGSEVKKGEILVSGSVEVRNGIPFLRLPQKKTILIVSACTLGVFLALAFATGGWNQL